MKEFRLLIIVSLAFLTAFGQAKPRLATLAQQKVCAEQAKKTFHEDNPTRPAHMVTWEYTSHYDASMNVCYIMTHFAQVKDSTVNVSYSVYDAFEGRGYASFIQINPKGRPFCEITPPSRDSLSCGSSDEFEVLVDKYFGIGR